MLRTLRMTLGLFVALLLGGAAAAAPAKPMDAKAYYQSGISHYNLAEMPEALADFKEAYRLHPDPVFLFNIAQCHRRMEDPAQAASFYRAYLREAPAASNRKDVERLIGEMDAAAQAKAKAKAAEEERQRQEAKARQAQLAAPAPAAAPVAASLTETPPERPLAKKPAFWIGVGAAVLVVAAAAVTVGVLASPRDPMPTLGTAAVR